MLVGVVIVRMSIFPVAYQITTSWIFPGGGREEGSNKVNVNEDREHEGESGIIETLLNEE
jgi:hypothetical protein